MCISIYGRNASFFVTFRGNYRFAFRFVSQQSGLYFYGAQLGCCAFLFCAV